MKKKEKEQEQLRGVGKILDILWYNSANERDMSERMRIELEYYFGENWQEDMYKFIEDGKTAHEIIPVKKLDELK